MTFVRSMAGETTMQVPDPTIQRVLEFVQRTPGTTAKKVAGLLQIPERIARGACNRLVLQGEILRAREPFKDLKAVANKRRKNKTVTKYYPFPSGHFIIRLDTGEVVSCLRYTAVRGYACAICGQLIPKGSKCIYTKHGRYCITHAVAIL